MSLIGKNGHGHSQIGANGLPQQGVNELSKEAKVEKSNLINKEVQTDTVFIAEKEYIPLCQGLTSKDGKEIGVVGLASFVGSQVIASGATNFGLGAIAPVMQLSAKTILTANSNAEILRRLEQKFTPAELKAKYTAYEEKGIEIQRTVKEESCCLPLLCLLGFTGVGGLLGYLGGAPFVGAVVGSGLGSVGGAIPSSSNIYNQIKYEKMLAGVNPNDILMGSP